MSAGKAVIAWMDTIETRFGEARVIFAATRLRGQRWSRPRNISAEKRWRSEPDGAEPQVAITFVSESPIAVTPQGESIAIWMADTSREEPTTVLSSSRRRGQPWTAPTAISTSPAGPLYGASDLRLAIAPSGEAVAVWRSFNGTRWVIRSATRPPAGSEP